MRLLLLCLLALVPLPAGARERHLKLAGLNVTVWSPPAIAKKSPVVIFSHGFHGASFACRSLMEALAADGYWVFAPDHRDAVTDPHVIRKNLPRKILFRNPGQWTANTYGDRGADLRALLRQLESHHGAFPGLDPTKVVLMGHSLGGYTVLCVAGARSNWDAHRSSIKAVVALSPYLRPLLDQGLMTRLKIPVMFQCGTRDRQARFYVRNPQGAYNQLEGPRAYVEIAGANHISWCNIEKNQAMHRVINRYTLAFLDHWVKGKPSDPILSLPLPGVSELRHAP